MNNFMLVFAFIAISFSSKAQCEFPRNNGTNQYQNAIVYHGDIYKASLPDGTTVFSIEPALLGFRRNDASGDSLTVSPTGEWFFKWNYAAKPNRWQPVLVDCDATSCVLKSITGEPITSGHIEVDFFYLDKPNKISATFTGTFKRPIDRGVGLPNDSQRIGLGNQKG